MFCAVWRDRVLRQSQARTVDDVKAWLDREGFALMSCSVVAGFMGPRVLSWSVAQALKIDTRK